MNASKTLALVATLLVVGCAGDAEEESATESASLRSTILVAKYSRSGRADGDAIQSAIDDAIAATKNGGTATVMFEHRRYTVRRGDADRWHRFLVADARGITIDGNGATLMLAQEDLLAFTFDKATDVTLRNLTIDHSPWPFAQGTIDMIDEAAGAFAIGLDDGSPEPRPYDVPRAKNPKPANALVLDGSGARKRDAVRGHFEPYSVTGAGPRRFRITLAEKDRNVLVGTARGDRVVIARGFTDPTLDLRQHPGEPPVGDFVVSRSNRVRFENVTLLSSPDKVARVHDNEGPVTFDHFVVTPGPSRLVSVVRDGIHAKGNRRGPVILGSRLEGILDDVVNINTLAYELVGRSGNELDLRGWDAEIREGDELLVLDAATGKRATKSATVHADKVNDRYGPTALTTDHEGVVVRQKVVIDEPVIEPVSELVVFDLRNANDGFRIEKSVLRPLVNRAISATGAKGVIAGNAIEGRGGGGIWLANWPKDGAGPWARDTVVRNNCVVDARIHPAIRVGAFWPRRSAPSIAPLDGLALRGNRIRVFDDHGIAIENASGVLLDANEIELAPDARPGVAALHARRVADVVVRDLRVAGPRATERVFSEQSLPNQVTLDRANDVQAVAPGPAQCEVSD